MAAVGYPVSILIQPEGRMQRARTLRDSRGLGCFNPHPARRPDATGLPYPHHQGEHEVSILIQPEGRMQRDQGQQELGNLLVSILIQPEGRMQPDQALAVAYDWEFQSSSSPKAGCNSTSPGCPSWPSTSFNPHPARRPDATPCRRPGHPRCRSFNPHPARRPDATTQGLGEVAIRFGVQSSSSPKAGCNHQRVGRRAALEVSILIQPEGRMQRLRAAGTRNLGLVSILIQPEGRMQLARSERKRLTRALFQSSSSPKAGCNAAGDGAYVEYRLFQSSSSPKAGCN